MINQSDIKRSKIYPVLRLEAWLSEQRLNRLIAVIKTTFYLFVILVLLSSLFAADFLSTNLIAEAKWLEYKLLGLLAWLLAALVASLQVRAYLRSSYYFENIVNNNYRGKDLYTFTVGRIFYLAKNDDYLSAFMRSETGKLILARAGISDEKIIEFLQTHQTTPISLTLSPDHVVVLHELAQALYHDNDDFNHLLLATGLNENDFLAIVDWVVKGIEADELASRWWRKENLEKIPSLGRDWSYGVTPRLDAYCEELLNRSETFYSAYEVNFRQAQVSSIENTLARQAESNVLLVGEDETARFDVLFAFVRAVKRGTILKELAHKRILLFKSAMFLSAFKDRSALEQELVSILVEAVKAGDVILVIDDLSNLLAGGQTVGSSLFSLLDQFLTSPRFQVIAMSDLDKYHRELENRTEIVTRFETIIIPDLLPEQVVVSLLATIDQAENQYGFRFTYQALKQVVNAAESYFPSGSLVDKAQDLATEIIPWFLKTGRSFMLAADVNAFVSEKTNIPVGEITTKEQDVLLHLADILHQRVIGQDAAVTAVASTMKRARAGVLNQKRPLGSFLFLGPTGVGKTETAKALAFAYFGSEDKMMRLDMTEYQDADALDKLIGSFATGKPGVLTNMLRQNMFGVVLLDEFEKSHPDVLNLFLQILDEGIFSDMDGKKVNARNLIFIATSNAGAEKIWSMVRAGQDPAAARDEIINEIVNAGTYKPELLNRFDDCIIFHPLSPDELKQIAGLMLKKLAKRLEPKGITLKVTDYLAAQVCQDGANEVFGARPMNRYIQDNVEQLIADKIIEGGLKPGMTVEFLPPANNQEKFQLQVSGAGVSS